MIKNMKSGQYDIKGTVEKLREEVVTWNVGVKPASVSDSRSFIIHGTAGGIYLRNGKFIRKKTVDE